MIATQDEAKGLLVSTMIFIDQSIQDSLYEALNAGQIDRDRFKELTDELAEWQRISKTLLSIVNK